MSTEERLERISAIDDDTIVRLIMSAKDVHTKVGVMSSPTYMDFQFFSIMEIAKELARRSQVSKSEHAQLEAKYAELEATNAQMLEALDNLVSQIQDHNFGIKSPAQYETIAFVAARAAIAKAEGEVMP